MNKLTKLLKNPNLRFKTHAELRDSMGECWRDENPYLGVDCVIALVSYYAGMKVYRELCKSYRISQGHFLYGPMEIPAHVNMLTTKSMPKYDITGNILLPGMIVSIDWASATEVNARIPHDFKNEAGTITRVIRVVKPYTYHVVEGQRHSKFEAMDALYVSTELTSPKSGRSFEWLQREHKDKFKDNKLVALEVSYNLRRATETERKYYFSTIFRG